MHPAKGMADQRHIDVLRTILPAAWVAQTRRATHALRAERGGGGAQRVRLRGRSVWLLSLREREEPARSFWAGCSSHSAVYPAQNSAWLTKVLPTDTFVNHAVTASPS